MSKRQQRKINPIDEAIQTRDVKKRMTLQKQEEFLKNQDTNKANPIIGEEYKQRWRMHKDNGQQFPLGCDTKEFAQFGVGLQLFFDFIKVAGFFFLFMSIIAIAPMYSNYNGDGLVDSYGQQASVYNRLSIANQPQLILTYASSDQTQDQKDAITAQNEQLTEDYVNEMQDREIMVVLPDMFYTLVFLFFVYCWVKISKTIEKEGSSTKVTPSYYTVYVSNIPSNANEASLKKQFTPFGKVCEVMVVRDYKGTLLDHSVEANIRYKIDVEKQRMQIKNVKSSRNLVNLQKQLMKTEKQIDMKNQTLFKGIKNHRSYPAIGAYVVFNERRDKVECLRIFKKAHSLCGTKLPICFMEGKFLNVRGKVDEPSNIKWEHLDATRGELFARRSCVIILLICVMFLTFAIIFIANIVKPQNSNSCPQTEITFAEAQANASDNSVVECYCRQISPSEIYNDSDKKEFCWNTYIKFVYLIVLTVTFGLVVIIVNFLLKVLLRKLGNFAKYFTVTKETLGIMLNLFFSMFINTALITLLFSADIFGFIPAVTISQPIPPLKEMQEEKQQDFSADFDRAWYIEVGSKITYAMLFNIFIPHITFLIFLPFFRWQRRKKANKAIIQRDMNENVLGPEYNLTQYYAGALNTIFVTMFYASGMPLLLWFATFSLFVQYWVYKYMLLRYNKRPPSYDKKLNETIIVLLPYAAILHLCIGMYMYSSPLIFPQSTDSVKEEVTGQLSQTDTATDYVFNQTGETNEIRNRAFSQPYLLALFLIIVLYLVFQQTIGILLQKLKNCCCGSKEQKDQTKIERFGSYESEFQEINQRMLGSYDIMMNPKYVEIIKAIDRSTSRKTLTQIATDIQ